MQRKPTHNWDWKAVSKPTPQGVYSWRNIGDTEKAWALLYHGKRVGHVGWQARCWRAYLGSEGGQYSTKLETFVHQEQARAWLVSQHDQRHQRLYPQ